jgi:hypothetical protein
VIELSEAASNATLDTLSTLMDGGSIELLSDTDRLLVVMRLSNPAAGPAVDRILILDSIAEGVALGQGNASSARIVAKDGSEVLSCDVGDENSDAVIKLTGTTMIHRGQPVRLSSFRLVMPSGG